MNCIRCASNDLHHSPLNDKPICKKCFEIFEVKRSELQADMFLWTEDFLAGEVKKEVDNAPTTFSGDAETSEDEHSTIFS